MRRLLNIKKARVLYEENLDRWRRPIARSGANSAYVVEKIVDSKGKVVKKTTRSTK